MAPHLDALVGALGDTAGTGSAHPYRRTVLLGGPPELTAVRILPALGGLYGRGLRLRVATGPADGLLADLTAGALDLVVSTVRPRLRGLTAVPLADEEFVLVAAPAVAARVDPDLLPGDPRAALAGIPLVAYGEDLPVLRRYWRHVFGQRPPSDPAAVLVADLRAVASAAAAGAGYTALPGYLVREHLADGRLVILHAPDDPPVNTFHLAWRTSAVDHAAVAAVRTQLRRDAPSW